jgi:monofunctional biosynthetic peptidoglycan transglycosylase
MINADPDSAAGRPPAEAIVGREQEPKRRRASRVPGAARLLRRAVGIGLGLVLLWAFAVFWLGLIYAVVPPVSTLMLSRWATLRSVERTALGLEEISPHLPLAVMASEDARFCQHGGVDWDALRDVVEAADEDGPSRGASTIPMQTAKNLFLWPSRSYLRKGLELPIALYIDLVWSKRRMMENYLNIAEWGEGIFGAEAAARHYFRKPAKALSRREAALLASALPSPFRRNAARPSRGHGNLAGRLMGRMNATEPYSACLKG